MHDRNLWPASSRSTRSIIPSGPTGVPRSASSVIFWVKSATAYLQIQSRLAASSACHRSCRYRGYELICRLGVGHALHLNEVEDGPLPWRKIESSARFGKSRFPCRSLFKTPQEPELRHRDLGVCLRALCLCPSRRTSSRRTESTLRHKRPSQCPGPLGPGSRSTVGLERTFRSLCP